MVNRSIAFADQQACAAPAALPVAVVLRRLAAMSRAHSQTNETVVVDESVGQALVDVVARFDALLRLEPAARATAAARTAAAELIARWQRVGRIAIELNGATVQMSGHACGRSGGGLDARWFLAATAGLSRFVWRSGCTPEDVAWLCAALHRVEPHRRSVDTLRQWLWSDGVTGFAVDLIAPAATALHRSGSASGASTQPTSRAQVDAERGAVAAGLVTAFAPHAAPLAGLPAPVDRALVARLRLAADAADFWIEAERVAFDNDAGLGERTYVEQHASWLRRTISVGPTLKIAEALTALARSDGTWSQALARELPPRLVGRIIGRSARLDVEVLGEIEALLVAGDAFAGGLASGLLERGRGDEASLTALSAIVGRFGFERMWEIASLDEIEDVPARSLAWLLRQQDAQPQMWADLVGWAPAEVAAWVLASAPKALLSRLIVPLRRSLRERGVERSIALIEGLVRSDDAGAVAALGEVMLETGGKGWAGRVVPEVCAALVRHGHGRRLLLPLFLDRGTDVKLRELVLRAMYDDPSLLEDAVRFRVTEMMEPKAVLDRIKAARAALKDGLGTRKEPRS